MLDHWKSQIRVNWKNENGGFKGWNLNSFVQFVCIFAELLPDIVHDAWFNKKCRGLIFTITAQRSLGLNMFEAKTMKRRNFERAWEK